MQGKWVWTVTTLKPTVFRPFDVSLLELALKNLSIPGSAGSLVSLLSERLSSSRFASLQKASSSISVMRFQLRSIIFNEAGKKWREALKRKKHDFRRGLIYKTVFPYSCLQSLYWLFWWFCWSVRTNKLFPLATLARLTFQETPPHNKRTRSGKRTANMLDCLFMRTAYQWRNVQRHFCISTNARNKH